MTADITFRVFKLVFRDESGKDLIPASFSIGEHSGNPFYARAESWPLLNSTSPAGEWMFTEVQAVAPSNAAFATFIPINVDQSPNAMYFDSLEAVEVVDPAELTNDAGFFRVINPGR